LRCHFFMRRLFFWKHQMEIISSASPSRDARFAASLLPTGIPSRLGYSPAHPVAELTVKAVRSATSAAPTHPPRGAPYEPEDFFEVLFNA
jgi:hypothetical protein